MSVMFGTSVIDPLYGHVRLSRVVRELLMQPEIMRLREVRLSNINSLFLPGSANISRFEHSLGVALLAEKVASNMDLGFSESCNLVYAALLHDVAITPFGHLLEEGFKYASQAFDHEKRLWQTFRGETNELGNIHTQIFRGQSAGFMRLLNRKELRSAGVTAQTIHETKAGLGRLGPLISGDLDLDNIDNVARMAYHLGLPFRTTLPSELAGEFYLDRGKVYYDEDALPLVEEWLDLRFRLYSVLMTNPADFSAKAMLTEAVRLASLRGILRPSDWSLTDAEFIERLRGQSETNALVNRFELGDLYHTLIMCWIRSAKLRANPIENALLLRERLVSAIDCNEPQLLTYIIKDKRYRRISGPFRNRRTSQTSPRVLGEDSEFCLFGAVVSSEALASTSFMRACLSELQAVFGHEAVTICDSEHHLEEAMVSREGNVKPNATQLQLF